MARYLAASLLILAALSTPLPARAAAPAPRVEGTWTGAVDIGDGSRPLSIIVTRKDNGALVATYQFGGPDAARLPFDAVAFEKGVLHAEVKGMGATLVGTLSEDGRTMAVLGQRGSGSTTFVLTRERRRGHRGPAVDESPSGGSAFHKNDITYSTTVVTRHTKWASKLPGGSIKGFFIPSLQYGRDLVELMQRLDLQPTTVSIDREWDVNCWGIGDFYDHVFRGDRDDFKIVYGYVEKDLTGPAAFEVMVIPGLNGWTRMTRASRDAILTRVQEGAGLVLLHPFVGDVKGHPFLGDDPEGDTRLWDISPLVDCPDDTLDDGGYPVLNRAAITRGRWEVAQHHYITDGVSLELLPEGVVGGSFYKYRATGDVLIKSGDAPILAVKQYGKGRVVALAYVEQGFMPEAVDPVASGINWNYWEYQYALLVRCLQWAAHRDDGVGRTSFRADAKGARLVLSAPTAVRANVSIGVRSEFGGVLGSYQVEAELQAGENTLTVPAASLRRAANWPGGKVLLDLIVRDAASGVTLNWAATSFSLAKRATVQALQPGAANYTRGDMLQATVQTAGNLAGLQVRLKVTDDLDRLLSAETKPAARRVAFSYRLADFLGMTASLTAELVDAQGAVLDQRQAAPVFVAQATRRPKEYSAKLGFSSGRPYWRAIRQQLVHAGGVDTGLTWSEGVNNGLDIPGGTFGIYWYHRGPTTPEGLEKAIADYQKTGDLNALQYNTKQELYNRTKDTKFLQRNPCFDDPAVMQKLREDVLASAKSKRDYHMDYYFVGDEGSLTSYSDAVDFCWSPHTLGAFRLWLQGQYGSLEALNKEWGTSFATWEAVLPSTTEEALKTGRFAPWADHRTYMEVVFARAYQTVRDAVVAGDPDGHIAVSGTQATNAYDGCDWYRLDQVIDDFLCYNGGNQWDLHRSFAKPGAMLGFWTGYGSSGLAVQNAIWTAAIHNVLYPNIFWMPSYLNPDLTYSKSARDMGEAFKALRFEGVGRLIAESERLQDGIAIHYSLPSVHGAAISLERPRTEGEQPPRLASARNAWVNGVVGLGMQFDFVSYEQLEKGALANGKYRVMLLPLSVALSPEEGKALRAFAESGGIVIADAAAGAMDQHCAWVEGGQLNDFFGLKTAPSAERRFTRLEGAVSVTQEGAAWGLSTAALAELRATEAVQATTGTALVKMGENDAVIVNRVGKGWAIYLNTYPEPRPLIAPLLAHLGLRPAVQVLDTAGQPITEAQVVRYRFGDSEALAIVKQDVGVEGMQGRDGVTVYQDANLGQVAKQDLEIHLPRVCYVTDLRTGQRLGHTDTVKTAITVGGALVLGLSDQENAIHLAGPTTAARGEHLPFVLTSDLRRKGLVRCHVLSPGGEFLPTYSQNVVVEDGRAVFTLPTALSDAPGEYTLRATDVITGATTEAKVEVK